MISIIVPVYNVEKYLDQCVQSVLKQSYDDYELILVDDGSTDRSPQICDHYQKISAKVNVIHKTNGGLSDARNKGTLAASGSYITYIDSDDFVSEDYIETLWSLIKKYDADIAVTGIKVFFDGTSPKIDRKQKKSFVFNGKEALRKMLYQNEIDTSACAMLIKKNIALSCPFPYGKYHEDEFTTYKYYLSADKVALYTQAQYYYRQRKGSIMHSFGKASLDELDAADNFVNVLSKFNYELKNAAKSKKFSDYCQVLLLSNNLIKKDPMSYNRIISFLNEEKLNILFDKNVRLKNRIAAFVLMFGIFPLIFLNKVTQVLHLKFNNNG
ncbi:glycosyltransferase family 2 protein [Succinivibrio dextrinosolvens]|uniref:glycosyltransferase family 2 protein n=1 Tax=Succinivibrio dextrinosolvens TaxID=83771 RepID=UPI0019246441|nr:glycosyltransferase family 2 protein [Succinivibrio dextrinosolvens]